MRFWSFAVAAALIGYLLGSINSAVLLSKILYKSDVRTQGSKNAGMTNMQRVFGKKAAAFTFIGDFGKGMIAVLAGLFMFKFAGLDRTTGACISGGFAVIGHNWPVYFGFRGGKGVLTTFSVMLIIMPLPALISFCLFVAAVLITKYVSLGSILAAALLPVTVYFLGDRLMLQGGASPAFFLALAAAVLIIARHHANIARLIKGTESKLNIHK